MALMLYILSGAVICAGVFISLPPPPLSKRLIDWKEKGDLLSWKGKSIFYINIKGSGENGDVICLHGFPTSSYDWIKILPDLQREFGQIVMLDFLGYGFSDKPEHHSYTISEHADIVEHLTQHLHLTKVHVLSHDFGDTVASELLSRSNSGTLTLEMLSLTMLNGGIFPEVNRLRIGQKLLLLPVIGYIASRLTSYPVFCRSLSNVFGENRPSSEDCQDFYAAARFNNGEKAIYKVIHYLRERRQRENEKWISGLVSTNLKVLMIYGPADPVNSSEFEDYFRKNIPNQKIVILESTVGHYPQWEDPISVMKAFTEFIHQLDT